MKTLFSFLLLLCPLWLGAQSVSFKNIWLEHNVNSNGTTGKKYQATIYADGKKAHWSTNPKDYVISSRKVTSKTVLKQRLAAGGGVAISIREL